MPTSSSWVVSDLGSSSRVLAAGAARAHMLCVAEHMYVHSLRAVFVFVALIAVVEVVAAAFTAAPVGSNRTNEAKSTQAEGGLRRSRNLHSPAPRGLRKTTEEDRVAAHFAKFGQVHGLGAFESSASPNDGTIVITTTALWLSSCSRSTSSPVITPS